MNMRYFATLFVLCLSQVLFAQDLNTTFRSKITFPGQTLANVWGYTSRSGHEYALLGGAKGLIIVDITNPDNPVQIVQIPGPNNLWKEIKTYSHYAYITSEGGSGIQIVNLKNLPSANLPYHYYRGDGPILNQLNRIHALHIDTNKGFLYAWGGDLFGGGAKIFDLKQDPYNPVYVGKYDQLGYIHDGYVENDTMYSGHIYAGQFAVVNMANKSAPELIATQGTPNAFTHNTWLADDRKTLLTTDEVSNSFLAAFDVSDPTDIVLLDKIQSNPGSNSIVHNTYTWKNWAITSWYKDGFTIVDITRPDNLVQVGNFDTYPTTGSGFEGCWGVYPYFPSGTIVASNINALNTGDGEMFLVTPEYKRACYLEGKITDGLTGLPLSNARILIGGPGSLVSEFSGTNGVFKMGQEASGYFLIKVSKPGYQLFESHALMAEGEVITLNIALFPVGSLTVSGKVISAADNLPVAGATVRLFGQQTESSTQTDLDGYFVFNGVDPGIYSVFASADDQGVASLESQLFTDNQDLTLMMFQQYHKSPEKGLCEIECDISFAKNPFTDFTEIRYSGVSRGTLLSVVNMNGMEVARYELQDTEGSVRIGEQLPAGMYFVRVPGMDSSSSVLTKIVKTN